MTLHAFVDESQRGRQYIICATIIDARLASAERTVLRGLRLRGQRRLHFGDESDQRRRQILSALAGLRLENQIIATTDRAPTAAREKVLRELVQILTTREVTRLVLDSRQGQDHVDRSTIRRAAHESGNSSLEYRHDQSAAEPLLWVPDAVAWAWGRGGDWRRRIGDLGLLAEIVDLDGRL